MNARKGFVLRVQLVRTHLVHFNVSVMKVSLVMVFNVKVSDSSSSLHSYTKIVPIVLSTQVSLLPSSRLNKVKAFLNIWKGNAQLNTYCSVALYLPMIEDVQH